MGVKETFGPDKSRRRYIVYLVVSLAMIWILAGGRYHRISGATDLEEEDGDSPFGKDVKSDIKDAMGRTLKTPNEIFKPHNKVDTLVTYVYFETDNALENALFFINHGLHNNADFMFILQGEARRLLPKIPRKPNVRIVQRDNTCMDLGAIGEVFRAEPKLKERYQKFILLNASIRGPFLPTWSDDCWSNVYTKRLSDVVKMQAMSAHCLFNIFQVQSMILATDEDGMAALLENHTLDCVITHQDAINHEIEISRKFFNESGWESNAFNTALHGDPLFEHRHNCTEVPETVDPNFNNRYFGFNMHPYETLFVKTNRDVDVRMVSKLTEWHDRMKYSSYDYC